MRDPKLSDYKIARVPVTEFRNQRIDAVDFGGQRLEHVRFFGCTITNCSFDGAFLRDLRMWNTTIRGCTFRKTNLRDSGLGGVQSGRVNHFEGVDFREADMRGTAHGVATFTECFFERTNLTKVDFQGSRFKRCRFRGLLREVMFYDHAFQQEAFEANRMENVDLSGAQLRLVEFRRLGLESVLLPSDEDHAIISNYPAFLDYALSCVEHGSGFPDRMLKCTFEHEKKWLGRRRIGILNRLDFLEYAEGEETLARFNQLLADVGR